MSRQASSETPTSPGRDTTYKATVLDALLTSVPAAIVVTDSELRILTASQKWLEGFVAPAPNVFGRRLHEVLPARFSAFGPAVERCLAGEAVVYPLFNSAPEEPQGLWWRTELTPWRDADGAIAGIMAVSVDVTDMVATMSELERSEQRLKLAAELADIHVWELDYTTNRMTTAGAAASFFDDAFTEEDVIRDTTITIHPDDRARIADAWNDAMLNDRDFRPEYRINRRDGQEVWAACTTKLVRDASGEPTRLVGAMKNITARKLSERALQAAKDEAEAANAAKSSFLANMSHEIRTPLNGILGMAEVMARNPLPADQGQRLEIIRQSGEALLAILNDALDLSKIEAGKLDLEDRPFDLGGLLEAARDTFAGLAADKGLALSLQITPEAAGAYRGDPVRIRQIVSNLVSNAVKFTDAGEVRLVADRVGDRLVIDVRDTGLGMTQAQLSRLFQKFEQADVSTTRRFGGTGLGLAICRELCVMMGGAVSADSRPGEGSCFRVSLPLPRADATIAMAFEDVAAIEADRTPSLRILAAEDNAVNRQVLAALLESLGLAAQFVTNGQEAFDAYRHGVWDVVFMDVQMPVLDGVEAARRIRGLEAAEGRARTPIVALTADVMSHQVRDYVHAGMDGYLSKPIRPVELVACLQRTLESRAADAA